MSKICFPLPFAYILSDGYGFYIYFPRCAYIKVAKILLIKSEIELKDEKDNCMPKSINRKTYLQGMGGIG